MSKPIKFSSLAFGNSMYIENGRGKKTQKNNGSRFDSNGCEWDIKRTDRALERNGDKGRRRRRHTENAR